MKGLKGATYFQAFLVVFAGQLFFGQQARAAAPPAPVPDTAQAFDTTATFGEDSDYIRNAHSYTKLDTGGVDLPDGAASWLMVRDNVTGLIWEVKTNDGTAHDRANNYIWADAQDVFIQTLNNDNFGGFNDWRLPTAREISHIIAMDRLSPCVDTDYFANVAEYPNYYWSADTYPAWGGSSARRINFNNGTHTVLNKSNGMKTRAVRSPLVLQSLVDNGDGTVTDTTTGLMWQQATGMNGTWEEALVYCEGLNLAGHGDWRLPDRNELISLLDPSIEGPSVNPAFFPDTVNDWYWTSTGRTEKRDIEAVVISLGSGYVCGGGGYPDSSKTSNYNVRAVRTAASGPDTTPPAVSVTAIVIDGIASDLEFDPPIVTVAGISLGQTASFSQEVTLTGSIIVVTAQDTANTTTVDLDVTVP